MSNDFAKQLHRNLNQKTTDELVEIWQTNNHAEWSEMTFEVIQEILEERLAELPAQNKPITEAVDNAEKKEKKRKHVEKSQFNWRLPLLGAIGFGIGFVLMSAIMLTIYHHSTNSIFRAFNEKADLNVIVLGAVRGIFIGGVGGAGLGLALKNRTLTYYLSLAGAIGFGWAFVLGISNDVITSDIGWAIVRLRGNSAGYFLYNSGLTAQGSGIGSVVGGIGGLVLGLALPKYRAIASLLLSLAGLISFATVFTIGSYLFDGRFFSSWNAWGGIVVGASLGIALALYFKILDYIQEW